MLAPPSSSNTSPGHPHRPEGRRGRQRHPAHPVLPYALRGWPSSGPTRSGRWTTPTSRWRAAGGIWWRCWTGEAAGFRASRVDHVRRDCASV